MATYRHPDTGDTLTVASARAGVQLRGRGYVLADSAKSPAKPRKAAAKATASKPGRKPRKAAASGQAEPNLPSGGAPNPSGADETPDPA